MHATAKKQFKKEAIKRKSWRCLLAWACIAAGMRFLRFAVYISKGDY